MPTPPCALTTPSTLTALTTPTTLTAGHYSTLVLPIACIF